MFDLVLGLLTEATPPEAGDGEGGVKTGVPGGGDEADASATVSVAVTAEPAVRLAWIVILELIST